MSRLGLREDDKCWRCEKERGPLVHMFYECETVHNLWMAVIQRINKILKIEFREGPASCILGISPMKSGLSTQNVHTGETSSRNSKQGSLETLENKRKDRP